MLHDDRLEALAAAFLTLGRLHLDSPDSATLTQLAGMYLEWPLAGPDASAHTAQGLDYWSASFGVGEDAQALRKDLNDLYGRTAAAKVAPFESVHRGEGLVFDEETLQVRAEYRQLGLQAPRLHKEPDDHIGLEFNFVAQGLVRALEALDGSSFVDADRYVGLVRRFYTEHLALWAPQMLASARDAASSDFYRGLAALSLGALEELASALDSAN
ncbi:TorD/DmsD family molecular chaperone [Trueperella pecoris]|uniref:TorD/DmsD family molecular chaperone n=1 Tax=Trueperella pecoris TaxID=2733571 RepID=UPI00186BA951|nr:molecular chaperone TorD family protein [Trueperella pecoris]QOQ39533.1 dehydrogenase [Trueperella pecoris]QTG75675.1 molecular chaperone TorD family protein [Trueperella pecoris]